MTETGVVAGFDETYLEFYDPLMRTALLLVGDVGHAEDLVQDAFARTFSKWDTIEHPKAYLTIAVTNGARNIYRGRDAAATLLDQPAAGAPDSNRDLHDSLLRLPYRQRAVVVLRYYVGLDDPAIAQALGCTRSTVRSSARRGLQQLRKDVQA
jgi:RNA polymerase sigma factor (sigma-70 family)